jgi:DNA helicase-2/ATP-dependent DNA helicase PcrA
MRARSGLVDFGELLLRAYELWRDNAELLAHYRERFQHVLVDEFQDTNTIQYRWVRLLGGGDQSDVFIVGDDDQCVYGWRGSKVENIQRFAEDFPGTQTIRLEQNYRSTHNILKAANALIANNTARLGKNLWTADGDGEPIQIYRAFNEVDEARFVAERIRQWVERAASAATWRFCTVPTPSRGFSRKPDRDGDSATGFTAGLRFFERAEIKDALAYLRLVANRDDDPSFERVVNNPPRGIGERTLDHFARNGAHPGRFALAGRVATAEHRRVERAGCQRRARVSEPDRDSWIATAAATVTARPGRARHRPQRLAGHVRAGQGRQGRDAGRRTWKNWSTPAAISSTTPIRSWWVPTR